MSGEPPERELIERLERENAALRRANSRLMRERIGSSSTAAAGRLAAPERGRGAGSRLAASVRRPLARLRLAMRRAVLRVLR